MKNEHFVPCKSSTEAEEKLNTQLIPQVGALHNFIRETDGAQLLVLAGVAFEEGARTGMAATVACYATGRNKVEMLVNAIKGLDQQEQLLFMMILAGQEEE